jgi:hypothetical protein
VWWSIGMQATAWERATGGAKPDNPPRVAVHGHHCDTLLPRGW